MDHVDSQAVCDTPTQLTAQEMFDKVARHLLTQRAKSGGRDGGLCKYRDELGNKCAIGCLIPDSKYKPSMEGAGVGNEHDRRSVAVRAAAGIADADIDLACSLQEVHDTYEVFAWPRELHAEAKFYGLRTDVFEDAEMKKAAEACLGVKDDE